MECGADRDMWRWTRVRMAVILRSNAYHISNDWPLRPQFKLAPVGDMGLSYGCWPISSTFVYSMPISLLY